MSMFPVVMYKGGDDSALVGVMIEEEIVGGVDQELNSHYNDGVSPDFILEDNMMYFNFLSALCVFV